MKTTVPVSASALIRRINRKLLKSWERVRKCSTGSRWHNELGDFYQVDLEHNAIIGKWVDLEALAKEEGVLKGSEKLA